MKCPLQDFYQYEDKEGRHTRGTDCIKEICDWWDRDKNCCSIRVIAKELTNIQLKVCK